MATDDYLAGCLGVLLFENPYSTKAPKTILGRIYSAKLAVTIWQIFCCQAQTVALYFLFTVSGA